MVWSSSVAYFGTRYTTIVPLYQAFQEAPMKPWNAILKKSFSDNLIINWLDIVAPLKPLKSIVNFFKSKREKIARFSAFSLNNSNIANKAAASLLCP